MAKKFNSQAGTLPMYFLLTVLGVLLFFLAASAVSFKDKMLAQLYPKQASEAREEVTTQDTGLPSVYITKPTPNSPVKADSQVNITASATDNIGVKRVEFYVGSDLKCSVMSSSNLFSCIWNTPSQGGQFMIYTKAIDSAGNSSTASLKLTVI